MTMIDLDAMERRAKNEVAYARQVNLALGVREARSPTFEALVRLPAAQVLALVARVRELQGMYEHIVSTAESIGNARVTAERKRCAEVARGAKVDSASEIGDGHNVTCEDIADAIERGDA